MGNSGRRNDEENNRKDEWTRSNWRPEQDAYGKSGMKCTLEIRALNSRPESRRLLIHPTFLWLSDYVMPGPIPENGDTAVNKAEENQDLYPCRTHFFGGWGLKRKRCRMQWWTVWGRKESRAKGQGDTVQRRGENDPTALWGKQGRLLWVSRTSQNKSPKAEGCLWAPGRAKVPMWLKRSEWQWERKDLMD